MEFQDRALIGAAYCRQFFSAPARVRRTQAPMSSRTAQEYREKLLQILPPDPPFDAWLKKTNALPPDFNSLPQTELTARSADVSGWAEGDDRGAVAGAARGDFQALRRSTSGGRFRRSRRSTMQWCWMSGMRTATWCAM